MDSTMSGHQWKSAPKKGRKEATPKAQPQTTPSNNPTPERAARGKFEYKDQTAFDKHHDMIARLTAQGLLNSSMEDAARDYQAVRAGFVSELGIAPIKDSCDASQGGFDAGDGNPAAKKAHDDMRDRIGRINWAVLDQEVGKGPEGRPRDLEVLRNALTCVGDVR